MKNLVLIFTAALVFTATLIFTATLSSNAFAKTGFYLQCRADVNNSPAIFRASTTKLKAAESPNDLFSEDIMGPAGLVYKGDKIGTLVTQVLSVSSYEAEISAKIFNLDGKAILGVKLILPRNQKSEYTEITNEAENAKLGCHTVLTDKE
jgi:hypothetical protein